MRQTRHLWWDGHVQLESSRSAAAQAKYQLAPEVLPLLPGCSDAEKAALFHGTAARFYRLGDVA
jgi:predicted TIM-barrel fold metal-dependent hydrolase